MPAEGIHLTALREALAAPGLGASARRRIVRDEDAARMGALLVDLPYFERYLGEVARYALGIAARTSPWGAILHEGGAIALLTALLDADDRDVAAALAALERILPAGTIDPAGDDVDLGRRFVVALPRASSATAGAA